MIEPGQDAPALSNANKVTLGFRNAVTPFAAVGWLSAAGYEQLTNGSPNFGTDLPAFGQRLGAAALRDSSEGIFTDCVFAPLLREDPRYYRMGPSHGGAIRFVYAITRPLVTRSDAGRATPNLAQLLGNLSGTGLTSAYYPQVNRGAVQTFQTFGTSVGGAAVGDFVREFLGDFRDIFHTVRH